MNFICRIPQVQPDSGFPIHPFNVYLQSRLRELLIGSSHDFFIRENGAANNCSVDLFKISLQKDR